MKNQSRPWSTPAERFRLMIERAIASGADLSKQALQLTHGDNTRLRKDPAVGDGEIRFDHGVMSFLGVRVIVGSPVSELSAASADVIVLPDGGGSGTPVQAKEKSGATVRKRKGDEAKPSARQKER